MTIYKKVVLNKSEINLIKASLILQGLSYRDYLKKVTGKEVKSTAYLSDIFTTGVVTYKQYEKYLKPLNLPFFKGFNWAEEVTTLKTNIDI